MRTLTLLALLLAPATALAQPVPAPTSQPHCTPQIRVEVGPGQDQANMERGALRQLEADLAARYGAVHPFNVRAALRSRELTLDCRSERGGVVCRIEGRICVPSELVPTCANGTLTVDALGDRDICAAVTASGAGISAPGCPPAYALAEQRGADVCRVR